MAVTLAFSAVPPLVHLVSNVFFLAVINSLFQSISRYFIKYSNFIHPIQSTPSRPVKWTYCKDKQKDIYILNAKHDTAWKHLQLPWIIFNGHNLLNIFPVNMISSGPSKMFSYFRMKSTRYGRQNLQWKTEWIGWQIKRSAWMFKSMTQSAYCHT